MKTSVATIVNNRRKAVQNMITGLENNIDLPDELVIVHMNEEIYELKSNSFHIREICYDSDTKLPLGASRNAAVAHARYDHVIFLDADCIPAPDLISIYKSVFVSSTTLFSGRVRYLPQHVMDHTTLFHDLHQLSHPDPVRENINSYPYELFWSLNFGCHKNVFNLIGGFDQRFRGYGAEDTDFAFEARKNSIDFQTIDALAYHQYHPSYDPPINHLIDIVENAKIFKQKWGTYPMEGWLKKFNEMNLIQFTDNGIKILRQASQDEITSCIKSI